MILIEYLSFVCPVLKLCFYKNYVIRKLFYSFTWVSQCSTFGEGKITREHPCPLCKKVCGFKKNYNHLYFFDTKRDICQIIAGKPFSCRRIIFEIKKSAIYLKNQQSRNPTIFNPNQPLTSKFVIFEAYYSELFKKYMFNCD